MGTCIKDTRSHVIHSVTYNIINVYLKYKVFVKSWTRILLLQLGLQISSLVRQQVHPEQPRNVAIRYWQTLDFIFNINVITHIFFRVLLFDCLSAA